MSDRTIIGKIHSVSCRDFVTYDDAVFYPGDYLNVIIGPNGTGKSTLVAAVVLGMGGNAKLLSRSSQIYDYIKNGKDSAEIEIKIYKNCARQTTKFGRKIESDGKSSYRVDGQLKTQKDFLSLVSKYNIQINNLCQFLPQDRVQDFAKMNPQEILISTINSVCSSEVVEQLEELKEKRKTQLNAKNQLQDHHENLKNLSNRAAILKDQIDQMNVRKDLQKEMEICEIKKLWLNYLDRSSKIEQTKLEKEQAKEFLARNELELNNIKKSVVGIVDRITSFDQTVNSENSNIGRLSTEYKDLLEKWDKLETSIRQSEMHLENKKMELREKENDIANETQILEAYIQDLENAIQNCGSDSENKENVEKLDRAITKIKNEGRTMIEQHRLIDRQIDELTPEVQLYKRKISSLESIDDRKLDMLRNHFNEVYQAVIWLRANRHLFERNIYEPMLLELNILNPNYAKYIENTVSIRDLIAFTCESKTDMNLLVSKLCTELNLQINVLHSDPAEYCEYQADESIESYKKFGFFSYLIDMIEGPAPILNYLCRVNGLHLILAGSTEVCKHIDKLPKHLQKYFAGNYHYSIIISKYSGDSSSMRTEISDKNLLSVSADVNQLNQLKSKLNNILRKSDSLKNNRIEVEKKINVLEQKRNELTDEKKSIEKKKMAVHQKKEKIDLQKKKIEVLKKKVINIDYEEKKFKQFAKDVIENILQVEEKKVECLQKLQLSTQNRDINKLKLSLIKKENIEIERNVREAKEKYENSKKLYDTINSVFKKANNLLLQELFKVKETCNGLIPTDKKFKYKEEFKKLPNNLEELTNTIYEFESRINCMMKENRNVIDEYENICKVMENTSSTLAETMETNASIDNQICELHNKWFPQIMEILDSINAIFGQFMASMEYVGEIRLGRKSEFDYETYGIEIFVQYRNNVQLQALDRFVQSGGERAVAIAVYTLSLQRITQVPFRCVDEINQGMDPRNERKIFEMLVDETAKPKQSQYFFITPKLLPNLPYNEYLSVHVVFNGTHVADKNVFNTA